MEGGKEMNDCIMHFTDFCMEDRIMFIICSIMVFFMGYYWGTKGMLRKKYWIKKK